MTINTYAELQTAVENWLTRSDLTARIPEFISLGEAYLNREIKSPQASESATVTTATANRFATLPPSCQKVSAVIDPYGCALRQRSPEEVTVMSVGSSSSLPAYFAITDQFEFNCSSDQVYSLTVQYAKKLNITTDLTNWLLTDYPDAYLYSSLVQAMPFIRNDQRLALLKPMLDEIIRDINSASRSRITLRVDAALRRSESFDITRGY